MQFKISIHPRPYDFNGPKSQLKNYSHGWRVVELDLRHLAEVVESSVWSPIVWEGGVRARENFVSASLVALDSDDGMMSLVGAVDFFCEDYHIIGTTANHQREKITANGAHPACDRYRIVLPFKKEITDLETFEYNMEYYTDRYETDNQVKDGARLLVPCRKIVSIVDDGEDLYSQPVKRLTPKTIEDRSKLKFNSHLPNHHFIRNTLSSPFEVGRKNTICYQLGCEAKKAGIPQEKMIDMILNSPEYKNSQVGHRLLREIERAVASGYKRY